MKPKQKAIWICSSCGNGHAKTTRKDAEACCVCPGCGESNPTPGGGRVYCKRCTALSQLECAQDRLESEARNYAFTIERVTKELGLVHPPSRCEIRKMTVSSMYGKIGMVVADALDTTEPLKGLKIHAPKVVRKRKGRYEVRFTR